MRQFPITLQELQVTNNYKTILYYNVCVERFLLSPLFFFNYFKLAERGLNVVLVSRSLTNLQVVARMISKSTNVQTKVIAVDFTSGPEIYDQIKQQIAGIEIGILVNNVGMFYPTAPDYFIDIPDREKVIQDIIKCNITSVPMMCGLILPQMVQRKKGLVLNMSSISSVIRAPNMAMYSASKAFVSKFSSDLGAEYESHGITVQGFVTSTVGRLVFSHFFACDDCYSRLTKF